jgi:DNA uptake protein ComE-like DNA-binding protein
VRFCRRAVSLFIAVLVLAAASAADAQTKPKPKGAAAQSSAAPKAAPLDINSATKAELTALPGIGDAYSQKIIDGRPYARKDELVSKNIVPKATYEKIKDQIVAKQAKK